MVSCLPARIWFSGKTSPCQGLVGSSILPIRTRRERKDPETGLFSFTRVRISRVAAHPTGRIEGRSDVSPAGETTSRGRGIGERRRTNICDRCVTKCSYERSELEHGNFSLSPNQGAKVVIHGSPSYREAELLPIRRFSLKSSMCITVDKGVSSGDNFIGQVLCL